MESSRLRQEYFKKEGMAVLRVIESLSMLSNFKKTEFIRDSSNSSISGGSESLLAADGGGKSS